VKGVAGARLAPIVTVSLNLPGPSKVAGFRSGVNPELVQKGSATPSPESTKTIDKSAFDSARSRRLSSISSFSPAKTYHGS